MSVRHLHPLWPVLRLVSIISALLVIGVAAPMPHAGAHPFGDPSVADVDLSAPDTVRVTWRFGMSDDLTFLAQWLELLPADRVMLDGAVFFEPADQQLLEGSPEFAEYLLRQVSVTNADGDCTGSIVDIADLVDAGVTLHFTCPRTVSDAQITLAMLTDMNPAYTTMASGPQGQRQVYDGERRAHAWTFAPSDTSSDTSAGTPAGGLHTSSAPDLGHSAALQLSGVLCAIALVSVLGRLIWYRRRGRDVREGTR